VTTLTARAFGFASTLSPKDLAPLLGAQVIKPRHGDFVVGYDFGALVFFGVDDSEQKRMLDLVLSKVGPEPHPPMEESVVLEVDPNAPFEVRFDHVLLPELDRTSAEVVALVLAQSVAMEYYEEDVDQIMVRLRGTSETLAQTGKFRGSVRELMKFIGSGMVTRNQVVFTLALLDTPQVAWSNEALDKLYRGLRTQFEIEDRYQALDHKLTMIQDTFELLADLTQQRRSWVLEVAVAILVAVEVFLFIYQVWHG
jgi:required for meiotic nuclear division protein 1